MSVPSSPKSAIDATPRRVTCLECDAQLLVTGLQATRRGQHLAVGSGKHWYVDIEGVWFCPLHTFPGLLEAEPAPVGGLVVEGAPLERPAFPEFLGGGMREAHGERPRFELLIPEGVPYDEQLLTRCAQHMAKGAEKYAPRNWEDFSDPESLDRARSSALRHLMQWVTGVDDGEDHAAAVFFNLMVGEHVARKLRGA